MERSKSKAKPVLGVSISPHLYRKLKEEVGDRKVSGFVEEAIAKKLEEKEKERERFQKELIADYKSVAKSKKIQKEMEIWDETISDMWRKDDEK